jgi:hypothetical protein
VEQLTYEVYDHSLLAYNIPIISSLIKEIEVIYVEEFFKGKKNIKSANEDLRRVSTN